MQSMEAGMQQIKRSWSGCLPGWWIVLLLFILAFVTLLPVMPVFQKTPTNASDLFSQTGRQVLAGQVLYRDILDPHLPLIYFVNAAGLLFGGQGRWGIWWIELICVWAAALWLYRLVKDTFGSFPALFGSMAFLANLFLVLDYGNMPEEYGLPLQCAVYVLLARILTRAGVDWRRSVLVGVATGLAVSLQPALISIGLAAATCLGLSALATRNIRRFFSLGWVVLGFGLVGLAWAGYFAFNQVSGAFWEQVFQIRLVDPGLTHLDRIRAVMHVFQALFRKSGFFWLSLLAWLPAFCFIFVNERRFREALTGRWAGAFLALGGTLILLNGLIDDHTGRFFTPGELSPYRLGLIAIGLGVCLVALAFIGGWVQRWGRTAFSIAGAYQKSLVLPLGIVLVDLPIQIIFAGLAGKGEYHSFIPVAPSLAVLSAFLVYSLLANRTEARARREARIWLVVLSVPVLGMGWFWTLRAVQLPQGDLISGGQVERAALVMVCPMDEAFGTCRDGGHSPGLYANRREA